MRKKSHWGYGAVSTVAAIAALSGANATAQETGAAAAAEEEEIVVTGSRIARPLGDELQPTTTIDSEFIDNGGYLNVAEAIDDVPLFSGTGNSDTDFNQNAADIGFTFVDLFGLGSQRTLTLVNGRRVPASSSPTASRASSAGLQVDLGTIPSALVQRVETISVGGAPIYGADAIAGTVNVILRDSYEGLDLDAQAGFSGEGDAENYRVRGVYGRTFANDRVNIVGSIEYTEREGLLQTDRPGANDIQLSHPLLATNPVLFFTTTPPLPLNTFQRNTAFPGVSDFGVPAINLGFGTAFVLGTTPFGFAQSGGADALVFDANGNLVPTDIGDGNGTFLFNQNQGDFPGIYRQQNYVGLLNESERLILSLVGRAELTDNITARARVNYSDMSARQPIGSPVVLGTPALPGLTVAFNNPFLAPAARTTLQGATVGGLGSPFTGFGPSFTLGKVLNEVAGDGISAESQNWSASFGLEGDFAVGSRTLSWDLTYSRGESDTENSSASVDRANFNLATDVVMVDNANAIITNAALYAAPSTFTFNPSQGAYVNTGAGQRMMCRSRALATSTTCMPFNPFGENNPQEVLDYIAADSVLNSNIEQQYLQANLSGELFDLAAGPVSFAVGAEIREEKARFSTDAGTAAGAYLGQAAGSPALRGDFTSRELYGETIVPLIDGDMLENAIGARLFDSLQFEGAYRIMDNSEAGTDEAWTAGGRLRINDSLTFRGNRTRSVRAPAITELFAGATPLFTGVADPCSTGQINAGPFPATRRANCEAAVIAAGLAANQAAAQTFLSTFTGTIGGVPGTIGGNPDLENETAEAWAMGAVFTPTFIPGLTITIDYNDIRIEDAISSLSGTQVLSSCFDSTSFPGPASCGQFTRNAANFNLASFQAGFTNIGYIDFAGLTSNIAYRFDLASLFANAPGDVTVRGTLFKLERYDSSTDGIRSVDQVGVIGREEWRSQVALGYEVGALTAIWEANYQQGGYLSPEERDGLANVFEFDQTDDIWTHDVSIIYNFNEDIAFRFIASNIFEEAQPEQLKQFANTEQRIGRTFYIGLGARF
jgi:outer membrane receptor protein involved in Fe transport